MGSEVRRRLPPNVACTDQTRSRDWRESGGCPETQRRQGPVGAKQHRARLEPPPARDLPLSVPRRLTMASSRFKRLGAEHRSLSMPIGTAAPQLRRSPDSSKSSNCCSSRMDTPSCSALASLAAPGASPTTTARVFFDTEPGDFPPGPRWPLRPPRGCSGEVPVTTTDLPAKRLARGPREPPGIADVRLDQVHPTGTQPLDHRPVDRRGEPADHAGGDDRPDAVDGRPVAASSARHDGVDRRPTARARATEPTWPRCRMPRPTRRRCSGRDRDSSMAPSRLAIDSCWQIPRGPRRWRGEAVEVGHVLEQSVVDEQLHPLLAQALDVHGRAGGEVGDALDPLARAVEIGAEGVALIRAAAPAARRSWGTRSGTSTAAGDGVLVGAEDRARPPRGSRRRPCGPSPCRRDGRPWPEPGPRCGGWRARRSSRRRRPARARRTGWPFRSGRWRRRCARSSVVPLLGRELVGDGPPGRPRRGPELALQGEVVDLDHHPVDLVVEIVAPLLPRSAEVEGVVEAVDELTLGVDREAGPASQSRVAEWVGVSSSGGHETCGRSALPARRRLQLPHLVGPEGQRPAGGDRRVLLPERAGRRIARVDEESLARRRPAGG